MSKQVTPDPTALLALFAAAPAEALLPQEIVAAVLGVPPGTLEKARHLGLSEFPPFVKIGVRVRYRKSTVVKHLAKLEERCVA